MSTSTASAAFDSGELQRDLERRVATIMLRRLVATDLSEDQDWAAIEASSRTQLLGAGPPDRVLTALARVTMIIEEYLLEMACRPTIGRARSTVVSGISQIIKDTADLPRHHDILTRIQSSGTETFHIGDPHRPGRVIVDTGAGTLTVDHQQVNLTPPEWRILICLLVNHDRIVTDSELRDAGWNGQPVSRATLATTISKIRHKLGDDSATQRMIRTASGRGYRLAAEVYLQHRRRCEPSLPEHEQHAS